MGGEREAKIGKIGSFNSLFIRKGGKEANSKNQQFYKFFPIPFK